jgi:ABC-2 type transport system permease protein
MVRNNIKEFVIVQAMFNGFFFWFLLIVLVPLMTMRTFAEEFKMGTIEMLLTAPVREWEVVLAKYGAALTFFLLLWGSSALNLVYLHVFTTEKQPIVWGMTLLPYLMLSLLSAFYVAVGIFASSLTKNQIIAGVVSFAVIFFFFCLSFLSFLGTGEHRELLSYFSATEQMDTFSKGIFDTRSVVLYVSGTIFFLFLTQRMLQARRLRS